MSGYFREVTASIAVNTIALCIAQVPSLIGVSMAVLELSEGCCRRRWSACCRGRRTRSGLQGKSLPVQQHLRCCPNESRTTAPASAEASEDSEESTAQAAAGTVHSRCSRRSSAVTAQAAKPSGTRIPQAARGTGTLSPGIAKTAGRALLAAGHLHPVGTSTQLRALLLHEKLWRLFNRL